MVNGDAVTVRTSDADDTLPALYALGRPITAMEVGGGGLEEALIALTSADNGPVMEEGELTMAAFLRFEIVRSLRNVRFVVFIAGFPVLLYLIYAKQTGTSQGLTVAAILLVSMAVWSGMGSAMFATGPQLAKERQNGWMRQLRVSPISAPRWFAAKLAQGLLLIIPGFVLLILLGFGYGHVHLAAGRWRRWPRCWCSG